MGLIGEPQISLIERLLREAIKENCPVGCRFSPGVERVYIEKRNLPRIYLKLNLPYRIEFPQDIQTSFSVKLHRCDIADLQNTWAQVVRQSRYVLWDEERTPEEEKNLTKALFYIMNLTKSLLKKKIEVGIKFLEKIQTASGGGFTSREALEDVSSYFLGTELAWGHWILPPEIQYETGQHLFIEAAVIFADRTTREVLSLRMESEENRKIGFALASIIGLRLATGRFPQRIQRAFLDFKIKEKTKEWPKESGSFLRIENNIIHYYLESRNQKKLPLGYHMTIQLPPISSGTTIKELLEYASPKIAERILAFAQTAEEVIRPILVLESL